MGIIPNMAVNENVVDSVSPVRVELLVATTTTAAALSPSSFNELALL